MALSATSAHLRRDRLPSPEAFLARVSLCESTLMQTLIGMSKNIVESFSSKSFLFQHKNFRSLIRKMEIFVMLFEYLHDSSYSFTLSSTAKLCFEEFYVLLFQIKILLDQCLQTSRLWLLIQNCMMSHCFQDLDREILVVLDVLPLQELISCEDVREQVELLKKQLERDEFSIDQRDEAMRIRLFGFIEEFGVGMVPDALELQALFQDQLGIQDAKGYKIEIEFLEELVRTYDDDIGPTSSVLKGVIALTRYCRFLFCGFEDDKGAINSENQRQQMKSLLSEEIAKTFETLPKEFCCPISLDLMQDPVVVSSGQTYDRSSISRWMKRQQMKEKSYTCPGTGQLLTHAYLAPNRALRNLISVWCVAQGISLDPLDNADTRRKVSSPVSSTRAVIEANRATAVLLIKQLSCGPDTGKTSAARGLQLLASFGKENAMFIAEAGVFPILQDLLSSPNPEAQESSLNAIISLTAYYSTMRLIMEELGCLEMIVKVLRHGNTEVAREKAAGILLTLCQVHDYKRRIASKEGAISGLLWLMIKGNSREKEVAISTLYLLSGHVDSCNKMIEAGAVNVLAEALEIDEVAESAAAVLSFLVKQDNGADAVRNNELALSGLLELRNRGTLRGRANADAALGELCRDCLRCNHVRRSTTAVYRFVDGRSVLQTPDDWNEGL